MLCVAGKKNSFLNKDDGPHWAEKSLRRRGGYQSCCTNTLNLALLPSLVEFQASMDWFDLAVGPTFTQTQGMMARVNCGDFEVCVQRYRKDDGVKWGPQFMWL